MEKETLTSVETFYNEDRSICMKIPYKNGKMEGNATTHKNNELIQESTYKNDKLNGKLIIYDKGKRKTVINFNDGVQDGEACYYGDNVNLIGKENYSNGLKEGLSEWYNPEGEILYKEHYQGNKLNGEKIIYEEGKVKKRLFYDKGQLVKEVKPEEKKNNKFLVTIIKAVLQGAIKYHCRQPML